MAKKLIDAAVEAGVDYVKFQSFVAERLVSPIAKKAEYQYDFKYDDKYNDFFEKLNIQKMLI